MIIKTVKVQKGSGSYSISIPQDVIERFQLKKSDTVAWCVAREIDGSEKIIIEINK